MKFWLLNGGRLQIRLLVVNIIGAIYLGGGTFSHLSEPIFFWRIPHSEIEI